MHYFKNCIFDVNACMPACLQDILMKKLCYVKSLKTSTELVERLKNK